VNDPMRTLFQALMMPASGDDALGGVNFSTLPDTPAGTALKAFASALAGTAEIAGSGDGDEGDETGSVLGGAVHRIRHELDRRYRGDARFAATVDSAAAIINATEPVTWQPKLRETLWSVFFPEGTGLVEEWDRNIADLRARRVVEIERLNPEPLSDPARELLFTSNILVTVPTDTDTLDALDHGEDLKQRIRATMDEVQLYYYDHPIHIGVETANNEAIYGMRGLDTALAWEKERGTVAADAQATVVLSLSVTHDGLHTVAREYLQEEFSRGGPFEHLTIYLFTEPDCRQIVETVLAPWLPNGGVAEVQRVFGVDGEYGRHYSFLKAIAAFWHVFVDRTVRGTFKIDLDQVFPQDELLQESGASAMQHFSTPLWGAEGRDRDGTPVELGMIAGSLVNEKDIGRGLFTPDVPPPDTIPPGEAAVFFNRIPMALSTEAEMMTRYAEQLDIHGAAASVERDIDGRTHCIQRYHVTGGTNGILVSHLRRHRPFTPTFVGRAEDQAYILSVLYDDAERVLRYVHKPGLIMRHDKEAFAGEAIKAAAHGRFIGDLARTWIYTRYAASLPWGMARTKRQIDPFTGCFVSEIPYTIIFLRLALYCAGLLAADPAADETVQAILSLAERKLVPLFEQERDDYVATEYRRQRAAWDMFYDALDGAEAHPQSEAATTAREITARCRVS
jgi:hypothetical protein